MSSAKSPIHLTTKAKAIVPTKIKATTAPAATTTASAAPAGASGAPTFIFPDAPAGTNTIYNLPTGTSPFVYPALPSDASGPNTPRYNQGQQSPSSSNSNLGLIVGVTVAGVAVICIVGLLIQRARGRGRTNNSHQQRRATPAKTQHHHQASAATSNITEDSDRDKGQLGRSFTIRKPPSVYVDDDQDLDLTGHPQYKSASDALNHPYYGDRTPGLIEYELSDTSGQKNAPSSIAERKRYVEQQQRIVMDEYEMFSPHKDVPPPSPYPASSAPSYTSGNHGARSPAPSMTPNMGGRSPRVQQTPTSPFGRSQFDSSDYTY
ncbi:hypothetical protein BGX31_007267 [Mortierella sp. GBA43]|nr:hypothetical protein BGX31_007267 [Mortierella sp. GBA43]